MQAARVEAASFAGPGPGPSQQQSQAESQAIILLIDLIDGGTI